MKLPNLNPEKVIKIIENRGFVLTGSKEVTIYTYIPKRNRGL
ncbi:MAG: hypothetical protein PHI15_09695 [Methanomicrobium sp.]|nr:hypothetical protein [Methanomicrobium sp.]